MRFNINDYVSVRLTDWGLEILKMQHERLNAVFGLSEPFKPPETDENGFVRYQLWAFMAKFGSYTGNGLHAPFEYEVIIGRNAEAHTLRRQAGALEATLDTGNYYTSEEAIELVREIQAYAEKATEPSRPFG